MKHKASEDNSDFILWQKFKKGDHQAFTRIYKDFYPPLLVYGLKIKNDHEFVKDCIQEMFFDIMSHIQNLGDTDNILLYLITSLRRKIFRKLQYDFSFRYNKSCYSQSFEPEAEASDELLFRYDRNRRRKRLIRDMVNHLPPRQKEALLMKFYLHLEYKDIAMVMGLNIQSVRNLIHKAIKALRIRVNAGTFSYRHDLVDN